ncbi:MAG: AbrB/MazE/SpoVT family DNA-binding domain-containing protein [Desulfohalobiaceae bacterium]|nr:AbrB/MazE/SpoVT family DNA-binding domain-containing protein [Desulfohalobiaceae bacterium]
MSRETPTTALTQKSQITLPKRIREYLGLAPGDQVRFEIVGHAVRIVPVVSRLEENFGKVTPCNRPEDFRRLREDFEKGVGKEAGEES